MSPRPAPRSRAAIATTVVGVVLGLAAAAFVARTLARDWAQIEEALGGAAAGWLALAVVLAAVGMTAIAVPWRAALRLLGDDMPLDQVVARYYVGEIGKYLPGGLWPVVGRGELAARWGVRRSTAYGSVALSLVALYLAAMLVAALLLPAVLGDGAGAYRLVLLLLPIGLAALHPRAIQLAVGLLERLTKRTVAVSVPSWGASISLVVRYLPAWGAIGAATWAIARALEPSAPVLEVFAAAVLSWVVGFVLVPVPGGVGVREAAFVAAASSLDPGIAAAVAVAARAGFVLVDGLGAAAGSVVLGARRGPGRDAPAAISGP